MRINNEAAHAIRGMMDRAIEAPIHRDQRDIEAAVYDEANTNALSFESLII
jgi:hypothetical protein